MEDTTELMETIRQYRCLYDRGCSDFKNKAMKNNAWKEIAEKLGMQPVDAEKKYNNTRTTFGRYIKSLTAPSGSGRDSIPPIKPEYEHLRWLITHIKPRTNTTNNFGVHCRLDDNPTTTTTAAGGDGGEESHEDLEQLASAIASGDNNGESTNNNNNSNESTRSQQHANEESNNNNNSVLQQHHQAAETPSSRCSSRPGNNYGVLIIIIIIIFKKN